jgi:hypothetical protein
VKEPDAPDIEDFAVGIDRIDHHHSGPVEGEMPLDQRQGALPDRAEADHHDGAIDAGVNGPIGHGKLHRSTRRSACAVRTIDDR